MSDESNTDLGQMQAELNIDGLIKALVSEDKQIRQRAATALRSLSAVSALPALQASYEVEQDPETGFIFASAIEVLRRLSSSEDDAEEQSLDDIVNTTAMKQLVENLKSSDSDLVIKAAEKLGDIGNKIVVEPLIMVFNNQRQSIHVRLAVAEALLKLESAPVEVALLANLRHSDWHIRRNGAAILGQLKAEWAIEPLGRSLADPHPVVRRTALAALKNIGTPESRKALAKFSPGLTQNPAASQQTTRRQVSGIEVKRPGQQQSQDDTEPSESALLKRLRKQRRDAQRARLGTQPLNPNVLKQHAKGIAATQPIPDEVLNALEDVEIDSDE